MLNIGGNKKKAYLGNNSLSMAHLGDVLVYSKTGPFIATYQIDDIAEPLTLPVTKDYEVDWGDNVTTTTGKQHFYSTTGVKTVKMFGVVDDFVFPFSDTNPNSRKITSITNWGGLVLGSGTGELNWCRNLLTAPNNYNNTSSVSWGNVFRFCDNLNHDFTNFSNVPVINLSSAFLSNKELRNQDLSFLDTSNCVRFTNCFNSSNYNVDSSWIDTSNAVFFEGVFSSNSLFNQSLNHLDTSKVEGFSNTFQNATSFNQDVSSWDYSTAKTVSNFMAGKSPANYDYQYYDNLLIKWASGAANGGLDFTKLTVLTTNFGTIQYSSAGAAAHDSLVAQGLIITDGGQNAF